MVQLGRSLQAGTQPPPLGHLKCLLRNLTYLNGVIHDSLLILTISPVDVKGLGIGFDNDCHLLIGPGVWPVEFQTQDMIIIGFNIAVVMK